MKDFLNKLVLITGGSSGIGLACAELLAQRGANVFLVARCVSESCVEALKKVQRVSVSQDQVHGVIVADITEEAYLRNEIGKLEKDVGVPDLLINSAGITRPGYFVDLDPQIVRDLMEVNYFGTVNVIRSVLPGMMQRRSGHIVNISSGAGIIAIIGYTAYAASKFAVRGFTDSLRPELKPYGIQVSIVFPPDTDTPQLAGEEPYKPPEVKALVRQNSKVMTAEAVAKEILRGVERNRYMILPGWDMKQYFLMSNILGSNTYRGMDWYIAQSMKKAARKNKGDI